MQSDRLSRPRAKKGEVSRRRLSVVQVVSSKGFTWCVFIRRAVGLRTSVSRNTHGVRAHPPLHGPACAGTAKFVIRVT